MLRDWRFRRSLRALQDDKSATLASYAKATWPPAATPVQTAKLVALDFEFDGLQGDAHLLQVGWVAFTARCVPLANARSIDIRSERRLDAKAVVIHGIGEDRARQGTPISEALETLIPELAGKIVIAHGASIERDCLRRSSRSVYSRAIPVRTICTMAVERKLHPGLTGTKPYRLGASRARYNLPPHALHSALGDAIATAELFLAQLSHFPADATLGQLEALRVRH